MKFIQVHTTNTTVIYKNSICSTATIVVISISLLSIIVPIILMTLFRPYSGITESRIIYEKPQVDFKYKSVLVGETASYRLSESNPEPLMLCNNFAKLPKALAASDHCGSIKYWSVDLNNNGFIDTAHFSQEIYDLSYNLSSIGWILLMEAKLQHKCLLTPPAIIVIEINIPPSLQLRNGKIIIDGELQLKQFVDFVCPFFGQPTQTQFQSPNIHSSIVYDLKQNSLPLLLRKQLRHNPGYFHVVIHEMQFEFGPPEIGLTIHLNLDILNVAVRYRLNIWEHLGEFWLYFASFFSLSFYVTNKLKDYLFSKHIIRSWEIIPWKKLY